MNNELRKQTQASGHDDNPHRIVIMMHQEHRIHSQSFNCGHIHTNKIIKGKCGAPFNERYFERKTNESINSQLGSEQESYSLSFYFNFGLGAPSDIEAVVYRINHHNHRKKQMSNRNQQANATNVTS